MGIHMRKVSRNSWTGSLLLVAAIILFGGAFLQQLIAGPHSIRDVSATSRIFNAASYVAVHLLALTLIGKFVTSGKIVLKQFWPFWIYLFVGFFSVLWAVDPTKTLYSFYALPMTVIAGVVVALSLPFDRFIKITAYTVLACAVASLIYIFFIPSWGRMSNDAHEFTNLAGLPQGVFRHKNQLAEMMAIGIIVALGGRRILPMKVFLPLLLTTGYCLIAASSAGKTFGIVLAIGALVAWRLLVAVSPGRSAALILGALGITAGLLVLPEVLLTVLPQAGKDVTLTGRTMIWAHAFDIGNQRPLTGYGLGSIWSTQSLANIPGMVSIAHSHNVWIEMFVKLGYLGPMLGAMFLLKIGTDLLATKADLGPHFRFAFLILMCGIGRSSLEVWLFENNDLTFFMLIVAATYNYKYLMERSRARTMPPAPGNAAPVPTPEPALS
jgi:exopolysaccharide production protein ExoQ